jgi:hypothetical protein
MAPTDSQGSTNRTLDTAERLVRLETKLDFLIGAMDKLPPSPTCVNKHVEHDARLAALENLKHKALGALVVVNILITIFLDKLKGLF